MGEPAKPSLFQGASVVIRKETGAAADPLTSAMSRLAFAAFTCGFDLISGKGFQHTFSADAETPEEMEASRVVTWLWDDKKHATFRPIEKEEVISFQEFERRFESETWYLENPDHPIAYLRCFIEKARKYREIIAGLEPALRHVRGDAIAVAPASATEEEIEALFDQLEE